MTKAEERANELYPPKLEWDCRDLDYDPNEDKRRAFKKGYEQAEKDLALTWEDIDLIVHIHDDVMEEAGGTPKDFAVETLRRFLEQREKK